MCFESLTDEEESSKPAATILRREFPYAVRKGLLAAAVVLVVLAAGQAQPWIVAVSAVGALGLGVVLHQTALLVGLGVLWLLGATEEESAAPEPA